MERKILDLFLFNTKLKFNEIEKLLKTRSNKVAYHLKKLIKKGILEKENDSYFLSETSEHLIPYLSEKNAVLPVILICIGNRDNAFLYEREKRPFKNKLSLPGGRLLVNESIEEATQRIMKEKFNINARFMRINSISLEHVGKSERTVHSFLLIFVSADTKQKIPLTKINANRKKIISSDYCLIKNNRDKRININIVHSSP